LSNIRGNVVVKTDELSKDPIKYRGDNCCVLQIGIKTIAEVGGVTFIADVINQPEGSGNMDPHGFLMRSFRQVLQRFNGLLGVDLRSEGSEIPLSDLLKQPECSLAKPTTLHLAKAEPSKVNIPFGLGVGFKQLVDQLGWERCCELGLDY